MIKQREHFVLTLKTQSWYNYSCLTITCSILVRCVSGHILSIWACLCMQESGPVHCPDDAILTSLHLSIINDPRVNRLITWPGVNSDARVSLSSQSSQSPQDSQKLILASQRPCPWSEPAHVHRSVSYLNEFDQNQDSIHGVSCY